MPLVTATFSTGGSVVITDTVEVTAIAALSTAITANTAMMEKQFGSTAPTLSPGGLTAIAASQSNQLKEIATLMQKQNDVLRDINVTLSKVAGQIETSTTGMANLQHNMTKMSTMQAMTFADQAKNNKFQQTATNAALVDAGKEPIVIKQPEFVATVKETLTDVGLVNAQVKLVNVIEEYITDSVSKGITISQQWILQTGFGKFISSYYAEAKLQAQVLYADDKVKEELRKAIKEIQDKRLNPSGGTTST